MYFYNLRRKRPQPRQTEAIKREISVLILTEKKIGLNRVGIRNTTGSQICNVTKLKKH